MPRTRGSRCSCLGLGPLVANADRVGIAIRFGVIEARTEGLNGVPDADALEALLRKGDAAFRAQRNEEVTARRSERVGAKKKRA